MFAAAIILLDQGASPPGPTPPGVVKIDHGGGGGVHGSMYDVVDYADAIASFREIHGEHPVARAVRRSAHIAEQLGPAKERREQRERTAMATGMLYGAALERRSALEEKEKEGKAARGRAAALATKAPTIQVTRRGETSSRASIGAGILGLGMLGLGIMIARRKR